VASIQFNSDMSVHSNDGVSISKAINTPGNVLPDNMRGNSSIQVRTSDFASYQQHGGGHATQGTTVQTAQLRAPTGLVKVGAFEVTPEVAATLQTTAPEVFEDPSIKAAETAKAADNAKDEEALRESLNRHSSDDAEAAHMMFVGEVPDTEAIAMLVQMHRDGAPSEGTLHKVAEAMGLTPDQATASLNKMAGGVQNQLTALATAHGVDPAAFSDWMRSSRREESLKAMTTHVLSRDVFGAWNKHLTDFVARTGPKR
jgi:hypothetical protein